MADLTPESEALLAAAIASAPTDEEQTNALRQALIRVEAAAARDARAEVDRLREDRGRWLHYTTHQVACPVGPWQTKDPDAMCTCGYTLLVDTVSEPARCPA